MLRSSPFRLSLLTGLIAGLFGCATEELAQLETEVGDLQSRLYQMQRSSERQTSTTTDSLQQVSQDIGEAFDEIHFAQSGLDEKIDQLSNRLLTTEQQLETLQTALAQLQNRMEQGNQALRQDLAEQEREYQASLQRNATDLADLRKSLTSLQERQEKDSVTFNEAVRRLNDNLGNRIDSLDNEVQSVYRDILNELSATTPITTGTETTFTETSSYPEDVYIVAPGDTLGGIAQSLGVSRSVLQEVNGITDPDRLFVGQRLKIPK